MKRLLPVFQSILDADLMIPKPKAMVSDSLIGEYVRMLLIATAICSAACWGIRLGAETLAPVMLVGNVLVVAVAATGHSAGIARILLLAIAALALVALVAGTATTDAWFGPIPIFSPASLLASFIVLVLGQLAFLIGDFQWSFSYRALGFAIVLILVAGYMIVQPALEAFLSTYRVRPTMYKLEDLTFFESLRIRTAKFTIFSVFTYCGACVASFINVVAASAPRGKSIVLRSSACPQCGSRIRLIDNLPIFSYMNLGGRCRDCGSVIPIRYFIVEVIGAGIFGLLFLFELVTGAANIPGFEHYTYTGIVWIILYTKWPVIGIYLYHAALFSCLLMFALMEIDRLRCPKWLLGLVFISFAALPFAIPTLQPVAFDSQTSLMLSGPLPSWMVRAVTCLLGGVVGWATAAILWRLGNHFFLRRLKAHSLTTAATLIGVSLGWQATMTIAALCVIAFVLLSALRHRSGIPRRISATSLLFAMAMLHQPAWKWLAGFW